MAAVDAASLFRLNNGLAISFVLMIHFIRREKVCHKVIKWSNNNGLVLSSILLFHLYEEKIYYKVKKWNNNNGLAISSILMFHFIRKEKTVKLMA